MVGASFTLLGGDIDAHWPQSATYTGVRLGYAYRVSNGLELGLAGSYQASATRSTPQLWSLGGFVRGFFKLDRDDRTELGLTGRLGAQLMRYADVPDENPPFDVRTHHFEGIALGVAPDLSVRVGSKTALRFSIELGAGHGEDSAAVRGTYLDTSSGYGQVGAWFGLVQTL